MKRPAFALIGLAVVVLIFSVFLLRSVKREGEREVEKELRVRPPAVARAFYPGEPDVLREKVNSFFSGVRPYVKKQGLLSILVVPHAGYEYSGGVAAAGFKQLKSRNYSKVILLGGSHQAWVEGAVIDDYDAWETPLGQVGLDKKLAQNIVDECKGVSFANSAHAQEHSLEVEVPFLQMVLDDFKIVPILLGQADDRLLESLADVLAKNMTDKTLVIVSTDLSHYPSYGMANEVDRATIDSILSGGAADFQKTIDEQMAKSLSGLDTCACGHGAVKLGMILAKKLGKGEWQLLKYANSGDVPMGDKQRVVGYAAIGYYLEGSEVRSGKVSELDEEAQEELLKIARETLESYLSTKKTPDFKIKSEELNQPLGAFVTLRKGGELRGCIGEFEPKKSLWQVVRQKAIDAAVNDPRFPSVKSEELRDIKIEISVLSPQQKIDAWQEIELGKHGVVIKKGLRSGVFLPQVATETGWDLDTFMGQLCSQKAGLAWDCWKQDDVVLYTFTAQVFDEE